MPGRGAQKPAANLRLDLIDPAVPGRKIAIDIDIRCIDGAWLFSKLGSTLGV
jgi:hypothetical protein